MLYFCFKGLGHNTGVGGEEGIAPPSPLWHLGPHKNTCSIVLVFMAPLPPEMNFAQGGDRCDNDVQPVYVSVYHGGGGGKRSMYSD